MKRRGKSPPLQEQSRRHGKPHRVQGQIGNRGAARSAFRSRDRFRVLAAETNDSLRSQERRQNSAYSPSKIISFRVCVPLQNRRRTRHTAAVNRSNGHHFRRAVQSVTPRRSRKYAGLPLITCSDLQHPLGNFFLHAGGFPFYLFSAFHPCQRSGGKSLLQPG